MNQEKIIQAIATYLENADWNWRLPVSTSAEKIATEIAAAIALHMEAGAGWEDAPSWAQWRTVDKNGSVTFWEKQPYAHLNSKYWCDDANGNRKYFEVDGWQCKILQRPR